jgi:hypothetical protein
MGWWEDNADLNGGQHWGNYNPGQESQQAPGPFVPQAQEQAPNQAAIDTALEKVGQRQIQQQQWTRQNVKETLSKYQPTREGIDQAIRENPWLGEQVGNQGGKIKDVRGSGEIWDVVGNLSSGKGHWQTLTGHSKRAGKGGGAQPGPMNFSDTGGGGMSGWSGGGSGGGGTPAGYQYQEFTAPGEEGMKEDPGYQFRLKTSLGALQNSAAARGMLRSGQTLQGFTGLAGEMASQEYQNVYNRRFGENQASNAGRLGVGNLDLGYTQAGNQFALGKGNLALGHLQAQNSYKLGQGQLGLGWAGHNLAQQGQTFNQGYSLANMGLQAAGQQGNYGSVYAQNASNNAYGAGNANAAGVVGSSNAWNQGLTGAYNAAAGMYGNYYANQNNGNQKNWNGWGTMN